MHAVMRRRRENIFDGTPEFRDKFRVMQEGDKQVNARHHVNMQRLKTDQGKREKEEKRTKPLRDARPQRDEKIHFFSRVMRAVRRPQNIDRMSPAMYPVE